MRRSTRKAFARAAVPRHRDAMTNSWTLAALLVSSLALSGCDHPTAPAAAAPAAAAPSAPSPAEVAAHLDTRMAVPLSAKVALEQKEEMRAHLVAVQAIIAAAARNDFPAVAAAAKKIGYSEEEVQMCAQMGAGAPGFTQVAISFHRAADTIADAAKKKDRAAVLAALDATLNRCVGCHAAFKQQIVDDATWARLTAATPPIGGQPAHQP
jgi:hypothetical protein